MKTWMVWAFIIGCIYYGLTQVPEFVNKSAVSGTVRSEQLKELMGG